MLRLDLTEIQLRARCFLKAAALGSGWKALGQLEWLTPPGKVPWQKAAENLAVLGALDDGGELNSFGERLARFPVHPKWGAIVLKCRDAGIGSLGAAMVAVASAGHEPGRARGNLAQAGAQLLTIDSRWPQDVMETFKRLSFGESKQSTSKDGDEIKAEKLLAEIWARAFPERMAYRKEGLRYRLVDGRVVSLRGHEGVDGWPEMVVAVNLAETGGAGRSKRLNCGLWVPCRLEWMREAFSESFQQERKFYWDAKKARVSAFQETSFKGALLNRKEIQVRTSSPETESLLVEKLLDGEMTLPQWDEKFDQLWVRFRLLSKAYPEYGFPQLNGEDKVLFLHAVCEN
jgi:HrpA-like RNA helicase